jgi:hypothetical protein
LGSTGASIVPSDRFARAIRQELERARSDGLDFEQAWTRATAAVKVTSWSTQRGGWDAQLRGFLREQMRAAYERTGPGLPALARLLVAEEYFQTW